MKVIGLSGAQGGGKSSLLIELHNRGWLLDQFRVSRAVQAELGWYNLEHVMGAWDNMVTFQQEVFKQKFNRDLTLSLQCPHEFYGQRKGPQDITLTPKDNDYKNDIILTERTFADLAAYTALWVWKHVDKGSITLNGASLFLTQYLADCTRAHKQVYTGTLILPYMDHVAWQVDLHRAKKQDIDAVQEDIERFLERKLPIDHRKLAITAKTFEDRAIQVETFLRTL